MGEPVRNPPYERLTILTIPLSSNTAEDVLADFDKLDLWSNRLDSEYPVDDINYNDGKDKKSHPFHKISKFYGKNKDVFLFLATLRSEKLNGMIMKSISDRVSNDPKVMDDFTRKIRTHLNRAAKGEVEADTFLNDSDLTAFFHGYHADHPGRPRNIHENLNVNVVRPNKILDTNTLFTSTTPLMTAEKSELKKVKIFANGHRVMNIFKDEDGKRNYVYTKDADADLEIGWRAKNAKGEELLCIVNLKINGGKVVLKKMAVEGEHHNAVVSIPELAKQNTNILVKSKHLHDLLDKLVIHRTKEAAIEIACVVQATNVDRVVSSEKLTVQQLPKKAANGEKEVFADFEALEFSNGPFDSADEINYNEGVEANPFEKIAKLYSRQKDVFIFNSTLLNSKKRAMILAMAVEKCGHDQLAMLEQFKTKMDTYIERISSGGGDAKVVLEDEDIIGYFSGCFVAKKGYPRNIHANLNLNVTKNGQVLETSNLLEVVTPRMEAEKSKLERVKLYGNGKRMLTVVKGENRQRNYAFSKLGKMQFEIEWIGRAHKSGRELECSLILEIKAGQITMKEASLDGVLVKLATMYTYAVENKDVLIRNKSLGKVLEDIFDKKVGGPPPLTLRTLKATIQPSFGGSLPSSIFDCHSHETLTVKLAHQPVDFGKLFEHPDFKEVLDDFEKLDFSPGPFSPEDKINYNDGQKATPFNKIRKYYSKYKDIFLFIAVLYDEDQKAKVMNIAKQKCGRDPPVLVEFARNMKAFLDRATQGRKDAIEFLGKEYCRGLVAFFAGTHSTDQHHRRNIHAHLNIDLGVSGKTFDITHYFHRQTPYYELEKGELESIKIYGNGKRIVTVFKKGVGQRNYTCAKFAEMILEIKWKALEYGSANSCTRRERECFAALKFRNGDVTISKVTLDGQTVQAASILELAKQNDKVFFRNKNLYDVMHFSSLKAAIKGATTLFFTAASGAAGGDATKLNNSCTDVFLMLMLQDEDEKERILDMVSKRSSKPEETRQEFEDRMDLFKQKFAKGDYAAAKNNEPTPGTSRSFMNTAGSSGNAPVTERAPVKPKRRISCCSSVTLKPKTVSGSGAGAKGTKGQAGKNCATAAGFGTLATTERAAVARDGGAEVGEEAGACGGVVNTTYFDDYGADNTSGQDSLILLGAESHPIELFRNLDWKATGPNTN